MNLWFLVLRLLLQLLWDGINVPFPLWLLLIWKGLCYKQIFHPWSVKISWISDKGEFQLQSLQVQDFAQNYIKIWVNCAICSSVKNDKGFTETSLQRPKKVEHSFINQGSTLISCNQNHHKWFHRKVYVFFKSYI